MTTYAKAVNGGEVEMCRHIAPPSPPLEWEASPGAEFIEVTNWPPPARPDPQSALFIQDGGVFWRDPRQLEFVRAAKNAEINAARLTANRAAFPYGEKEIACDELSRSDIDAINGIVALTGAMPANWVGGWKAVDNTYVAIPDRATWAAFYGAMVQAGTANFTHAQALKASLAAAATNSEIDAITWGGQ